jgi:hypothetical protein
MSSVGQAVGYIGGAIIGSFFGYPMLGAAIGGMIGGALDPPKGPKIEGPRLNDLSVQTSTYGAQIPVIKGSVATFGNIFWVENNALKETKKTEEQGGKGGGGSAEYTTYSYSATFALGLCLGPIDSVRRIWCSGKLIYDSGNGTIGGTLANGITMSSLWPGSDYTHAIPEAANGGAIHIYTGTSTQEPDPRMQAALGVANTPAYRGLAYIVFEDFQLADFGNSLMGAQFKVEVVETASTTQYSIQTRVQNGLYPNFSDEYGDYGFSTAGPYNPRIADGMMQFDKERTSYHVSLDGRLVARGIAPGIAPGSTGDPGEKFYVGTTAGGHTVYYNTTGPNACGYLVVGGANFIGKFSPDWELQGACVGADGNLYVHQFDGADSTLNKYDGNDLSLIWSHANDLPYNTTNIAYPYFPGTTVASAVNEGSLYWFISVVSTEISFSVFSVGDDGSLELLHEFTSEGGSGWNGHTVCPAAIGGICAISHNMGGFYVFDSTPVVTAETVPLSEIVSALCLESGLLEATDIDVTALTQEVRGYRITATAAIRAALEPLQACWPFDAIQHGYKIKFVPRGGSSGATVSSDDLGAAAPGDKEVIRLSLAREMDTQIPRRIETTFIDWNREYDTGTGPGAERLNTDAVNIRQIELPVVLTADEAACIEQTLLYMYWMERADLAFTLPPTFANLEPADIITVNTTDATHIVRLTRVQYLQDGRLECSAKYNHSPIYTPAAVGEDGAVTGQTLVYRGPTTLALLDVPCLSSTLMDKPGLLTAATGLYSGWTGAALLRSDDSGESYKNVETFAAPGCVIGYATAAIGAGATHIVDSSNRLNVRLLYGTLASVTELQMYNGANHFAYGAHGRWEIIAAKTVVDESNGTYTLRDLMRGRFGTERYCATHGTTDQIVLLDQGLLRFIGMDVASINLSRLWRAVTRGAQIDSATDIPFTWSGENLKPLAPISVKGSKSPSGDWTIGWTRRTRTPVEPFSGVAAPLAESSESYDVEIYSDSTYGTLKRTLSGLTTASATYTNAQQVTDFGAVQKFLYVKVYQNSSVIGRGYPAAAIIGPTSLINLKSLIHFDEGGYEYLPYRKLAIHCDGANGSTTFTDIHGKTVTANGNAQISTAQYPALTGKTSSAYFDGNGDYLSIPDSADWHLGSGDFTIRAHIRLAGYATNNAGTYHSTIVSQDISTSRAFAFNVTGTSSSFTTLLFMGYSDNSTGTTVSGSYSFALNTWYLVEVCRVGNYVYLFVDGGLLNTGGTAFSQTLQDSSTTLKVGAQEYDATYKYYLNGYTSEVEIYKGVGLHTASYTPSPIPFADSAPAITDKVGNAVTVTGTAAVVSNASSFGGYCLQANQASGYVSTPVIDLTADRWTIDLWITPDAMPSSGNQSGVFRYGTGDSGLGGLSVVIRSTGSARCYFGALVSPIETSVAPFAAGVRSHLFIMRDGPRFYIGAAGTVGENKLVSDTAFVGNKGFDIGYALAASLDPKALKIDEWRVFSGEASYPTSGNYLPPTFPFPDP